MNTLCVAVFVAVLAAAHASGLGLGAVDSAAIISGPSGTVSRTGLAGAGLLGAGVGLVGPAAIGLGVPGIALGAPAIAAAPLVSQRALQLGLELSVPAGSGLEGQWIPDINEKLYDDGQYRPLLKGL